MSLLSITETEGGIKVAIYTVVWACRRAWRCWCKSWRIETPSSSVSNIVLLLSLILSVHWFNQEKMHCIYVYIYHDCICLSWIIQQFNNSVLLNTFFSFLLFFMYKMHGKQRKVINVSNICLYTIGIWSCRRMIGEDVKGENRQIPTTGLVKWFVHHLFNESSERKCVSLCD